MKLKNFKHFSFLSQKLHCDCSYVTLDFNTTETKNWSRGIHYQIYVHYFCLGRVQAEGDKLKTPKFGKLFELLITFEIVSQSQKSLVHSWVIVVRTGCHSQILLITPNLRLTAVFVTFREGSFAIITFDLEPSFFNSHAEKAFAYP